METRQVFKSFVETEILGNKIDNYNRIFTEVIDEVSQFVNKNPIFVQGAKRKVTVVSWRAVMPTHGPSHHRLAKTTYSVGIYLNLAVEGSSNVEVQLCTLPVMVKSRFCLLNPSNTSEAALNAMGEDGNIYGGYYVISGVEKAIVYQEHDVYNKVFGISGLSKNGVCSSSFSSYNKNEDKPVSYKFETAVVCPYECCMVTIPRVTVKISVITLIFKLGMVEQVWKSEEEFVHWVTVVQGVEVDSSSFDLGSIDGLDNLDELLETVFPHSMPGKKATDLFYTLKEFVGSIVSEDVNLGDKDNFANKRLWTDYNLISKIVINNFYDKICPFTDSTLRVKDKEVKIKECVTLVDIFSKVKVTIDSNLSTFMTSGKWSPYRIADRYSIDGACQSITAINNIGYISGCMKTSCNKSAMGTMTAIRSLHNSQYGICDPAETPEGTKVGLLRTLTIGAHITGAPDHDDLGVVMETFGDLINTNVRGAPDHDDYLVTFNNTIVGRIKHENVSRVSSTLKDLRERYEVSRTLNFGVLNKNKLVSIFNDDCRYCRPLLVVKDGKVRTCAEENCAGLYKKVLTVDECKVVGCKCHDKFVPEEYLACDHEPADYRTLLRMGRILLIDCFEVQNSFVALYPKDVTMEHDFCEISPKMAYGVSANNIVMFNHEQAPRVAYSCSMSKQAIGTFGRTEFNNFSEAFCKLVSPQYPLISTDTNKIIKQANLPVGINATVAIMSWDGTNQEDSITINQSAIDRGLFNIVYFKTYTREYNANGIQLGDKGVKDRVRKKSNANYGKIGPDGIIKVGEVINTNDVLIHLVLSKDGDFRDSSEVHHLPETGIVDSVKIVSKVTSNLVHVRVAYVRPPTSGDKFASMHAQKGTVGKTLPEGTNVGTYDVRNPYSMPYTCQGITPDIIINTNCIPSRMTISQLIETQFATAKAISGHEFDANPFAHRESFVLDQIEVARSILEDHGYDRDCMQELFCDGKSIGKAFIGKVYYRRLKHMIFDKLSICNHAHYDPLTGQPNHRGRSKGLDLCPNKIGTMEKDTLCAFGASNLIYDRMMTASDRHVYNTDGSSLLVSSSQVGDSFEAPKIIRNSLYDINAMHVKTIYEV